MSMILTIGWMCWDCLLRVTQSAFLMLTLKLGKLKIEIHHRIPQMYIGTGRLFPEAMRTSLSNLQGLPRKIHREVVSPAWTAFRKANPTPTRAEVIQQAMRIDKQVAEHIGRIN